MYIKTIIAILLAVFYTVDAVADQNEAEVGKEAPDFTLTDSKGNTHSLSDFEGKVVVLEWINFGCPFVKKHYDSDNMQKLQEKYTEKDVVWLAVCSSAPGRQGHMSSGKINEHAEEHDAGWTAYLIDENGAVGKKYGAKTTPHMYIVDTDGTLVYAGGIDDKPSTDKSDIPESTNYVDEALSEILSDDEVSKSVTKPYGCSVKYAK